MKYIYRCEKCSFEIVTDVQYNNIKCPLCGEYVIFYKEIKSK